MISYTQRDGNSKVLATDLYYSLQERGLSVWLDIKMKKCNTAAMEEGVRNCGCVVAILSGANPNDPSAYFNREFCVNELKWARSSSIPITPVCDAEDKKNIGSFIQQANNKGIYNLGDTDIIHLDRSRPAYWEAGVNELLEALTESSGQSVSV